MNSLATDRMASAYAWSSAARLVGRSVGAGRGRAVHGDKVLHHSAVTAAHQLGFNERHALAGHASGRERAERWFNNLYGFKWACGLNMTPVFGIPDPKLKRRAASDLT